MMNERCGLKRYADNLSGILNMGSVAAVSERPMEANEQGFSGAALMRLDTVFDDGRHGSFICKKADLIERMVMRTLTEQGHQYTPAAYSEDCVSDEPMWMIQQDLGKRINAPHDNPQWMERVADALAEIHGNNMNRGNEMPWHVHECVLYLCHLCAPDPAAECDLAWDCTDADGYHAVYNSWHYDEYQDEKHLQSRLGSRYFPAHSRGCVLSPLHYRPSACWQSDMGDRYCLHGHHNGFHIGISDLYRSL